jgi:AsmA protein
MKKVALVLLALLVVVIAAAVVVPFVVPTDTYKRQIEAQVERATGRTLKIDGPLEFSLLPTVAVNVEDVRFANVAGAAAPDMARLKGLQAELKIWPLLRGVVEVDRFVLIEPQFHLEVDAQGRPNWAFAAGPAGAEAPAKSTTPPAGQGAATESPPSGGGLPLPISDLRLGDIRIENGTLTYADARSGTSERIEAINVDLDWPDLRSRLQADGSLAYKGKTVELDLALEQPYALLEGGSSPVRLTSKAPDLGLTFEGGVDAAPPGATGAVALDVTSIRDLAAWLATPIAFEGKGLKTLRIAGQLTGSPSQIAFDDATLALDAIEGKGNVAVDLTGKVPRLTGRLDLGAVDLNPYLPPETDGAAGSEGRPERTRDQGGGAAAGWSDEPIELPRIGGVEVDFALTVDSLLVRKLKLDRTVVAVQLKGPRLRTDFQEFALYGGEGNGRIDLEVADGVPVISQRFRLKGLNARPFLADAADFDRLEGKANAELAAETRGRSQLELVRNLNGEGEATFRNGAIVGINVAGMLRDAASALAGGAVGAERKTDFAKLAGTFRIRNGIVSNDDLTMQAPALRIEGSGQLDLPQRTVDYRVEPKVAQTLEGQGGKRQVAGLMVPVVVRGPWDDLTFTPDLSGLAQQALENPEALKEQIEGLGDVGKSLKKGDPSKALEGLLGQGDKKKGGDDAGDAARNLLKGVLGN